MAKVTTSNFDVVSEKNSKEPVIVMQIEDVPFVISSAKVYTKVRYDDPGVLYNGQYVYDGLRPLDPDKQKNLIDRKGSSSTISQKLEQWDGKASVETMNIKVIDKDELITRLCTPGYIIDEILNKKVRIYFGYQEVSYPEDYLRIFTGYINQIEIGTGFVNFVFTDPSSKRKQVLFNGSTAKVATEIQPTDTTITLSSTSNLYRTVVDGAGNTDPGVTIGIRINDEIMTYTNADIISGTQINVTRGAFGTQSDLHAVDDEVKCFIQVIDTPTNIALKTMLSGWNGNCFDGISIRSIVNDDAGGTVANSITFGQGVDVTRDYGVTIGDFVSLSSSGNPLNDGVHKIIDIQAENRTVVVSSTLYQENPTSPAIAGFRSKYDVYPVTAGLSLTTDDVFVEQHEFLGRTFVPVIFTLQTVGQESSGKTWIEQNIMKPIGGYSLTQGSRISMGITRPPLASELTKFVSDENVVKAGSVSVKRGLNTRFFYNEVSFNYGYDIIKEKYFRNIRIINADAQNRMNQVSVLEINVKGLADTVAAEDFLLGRAKRILQRYKYSTETVENVTVFFKTGQSVDAGDTVVLKDENEVLQIANTENGSRKIEARVMEIQERTIDISQGSSRMTLLSNNGFSSTDRYAVIAPASDLDPAYTHTSSKIRIIDSFSKLYPGAEYKKWQPFEGSRIRVHNADFSLDAEVNFTLDPIDLFVMNLSPALPFTPTAGMVVQFAKYDNSSASVNTLVKATFVHWDSSASIFSGTSSSVFTLDSGFSSRYKAGQIIYVMSPDGSRYSPDVKIQAVVGDILTIGPVTGSDPNANLGFTPQAGDIVQLGGFGDAPSGYRLI